MLVVASLLAAGCTATPEDAALGTVHDVPCTAEYLTVTHAADGTSVAETEIRAELASDLDPTEHWRVTAVACELAETPAPMPCGPNQDCAPRPQSACSSAFAGITADGRLLAYCGRRVERRDASGAVTGMELRKYQRVTFHVR